MPRPRPYQWVCLRNLQSRPYRRFSTNTPRHESTSTGTDIHTPIDADVNDDLLLLHDPHPDSTPHTPELLRKLIEDQDSRALGDLKRGLLRIEKLADQTEHNLLALNAANQTVQVNRKLPPYTVTTKDNPRSITDTTSRLRRINTRILENVYDLEYLPYPTPDSKSPSEQYAEFLQELKDSEDGAGEEKLQLEAAKVENEQGSQKAKLALIMRKLEDTQREVNAVMGMGSGFANSSFDDFGASLASRRVKADLMDTVNRGEKEDDEVEEDAIGTSKIEAEADEIQQDIVTPAVSTTSTTDHSDQIGAPKIELEAAAKVEGGEMVRGNSDAAARIAEEVKHMASFPETSNMSDLKARLSASSVSADMAAATDEEEPALEEVREPKFKEKLEQVDPEDQRVKRFNPFGNAK